MSMTRKWAAAAFAALAVTALSAVPANAGPGANGACRESATVRGYQMGVCISDRGTGGQTIFPDVYVNKEGGNLDNCRLYMEVYEGGRRVVSSPQQGYLRYGHSPDDFDEAIGPFNFQNSDCLTLHNHAYIRFSGSPAVQIGDSPGVRFCP